MDVPKPIQSKPSSMFNNWGNEQKQWFYLGASIFVLLLTIASIGKTESKTYAPGFGMQKVVPVLLDSKVVSEQPTKVSEPRSFLIIPGSTSEWKIRLTYKDGTNFSREGKIYEEISVLWFARYKKLIGYESEIQEIASFGFDAYRTVKVNERDLNGRPRVKVYEEHRMLFLSGASPFAVPIFSPDMTRGNRMKWDLSVSELMLQNWWWEGEKPNAQTTSPSIKEPIPDRLKSKMLKLLDDADRVDGLKR